MEISEYLRNNFGFNKIRSALSKDNVPDFNQFSCVLRIHELHYLFYSDTMKHFTLGLRRDQPKGTPGIKGSKEYWEYMMIPKVMRSNLDAAELVRAVVDTNYLRVITQ